MGEETDPERDGQRDLASTQNLATSMRTRWTGEDWVAAVSLRRHPTDRDARLTKGHENYPARDRLIPRIWRYRTEGAVIVMHSLNPIP